MSKLLILLLFAIVYNAELDGIPVYVPEKMKKLIGNNVLLLNVKDGEEFYIKLYGNPRQFAFWKLGNYEEISDVLDDFGKEGQMYKYVPKSINGRIYPGEGGHYFFKFKALRPSYNEISLKFFNTYGNHEDPDLVVRVDVSSVAENP